jgi:two-component system cell cycle sensor histidine kinase/response regulator CckA
MTTPIPPQVLVVDDEAPVRQYVEAALTHFGYAVVAAESGRAAIEKARSCGPFDLLLTDLMMPDMRGDELAGRLQQSQPGLKVLYLTGFGDCLFESRTQLSADESLLAKPATLAELHDAVSIAIYKHRGGPPMTRRE